MQSTSKLKYAISTIAEDVWVAKQDDSLLSILFSIDGRVYNMEYMRKIIDPCILWGFERRWSESKGMIISECVGQIVPFGPNDVRNFDVSALSQMVKESVQKVRDTQQEIYEKLGTIPATVDEVKAAIARYGVECIWD